MANKKIEGNEIVATSLGWRKIHKGRCIKSWSKQWIHNHTVPLSKSQNKKFIE